MTQKARAYSVGLAVGAAFLFGVAIGVFAVPGPGPEVGPKAEASNEGKQLSATASASNGSDESKQAKIDRLRRKLKGRQRMVNHLNRCLRKVGNRPDTGMSEEKAKTHITEAKVRSLQLRNQLLRRRLTLLEGLFAFDAERQGGGVSGNPKSGGG